MNYKRKLNIWPYQKQNTSKNNIQKSCLIIEKYILKYQI